MTAAGVVAPDVRAHRVCLAGLALAAGTDAPVEGARVVAAGPVRREAVSRAGGLFWFEDLSPGSYEVGAPASSGPPVRVEIAEEPPRGAAGRPRPAWVTVHVVGVALPRPNGG